MCYSTQCNTATTQKKLSEYVETGDVLLNTRVRASTFATNCAHCFLIRKQNNCCQHRVLNTLDTLRWMARIRGCTNRKKQVRIDFTSNPVVRGISHVPALGLSFCRKTHHDERSSQRTLTKQEITRILAHAFARPGQHLPGLGIDACYHTDVTL